MTTTTVQTGRSNKSSWSIEEREGLDFVSTKNDPCKLLAEMYADRTRGQKLDHLNGESVLVQDLYKFYARSCVEVLRKYFLKIDDYVFLYKDPDSPLFVPNETIEEAKERLKGILPTKTKKRKKGLESS